MPVNWGCEDYSVHTHLNMVLTWSIIMLCLQNMLPVPRGYRDIYNTTEKEPPFFLIVTFCTLGNTFCTLEEIAKVAVWDSILLYFFQVLWLVCSAGVKKKLWIFLILVYGQTATTSKQTNTTWSHYCQATTPELIWWSVQRKRAERNNTHFNVCFYEVQHKENTQYFCFCCFKLYICMA